MTIENETVVTLVTAILGEDRGARIAAMLAPMLPTASED